MTKIYTGLAAVLLSVCLLLISFRGESQTITTTVPSSLLYNSATADGAIVFAVKNTNPDPVEITAVGTYVQAAFTGTLSLWYHPTSITGAPGAINTTNGWVNLASANINNNPTAGINQVFTGLSLMLPANTTYRFAVSGPPFSPYYAPALSTGNLYSGYGIEIYTQDNPNSPGYGGGFPTPGNTPRGFIGSVTIAPTTACPATPAAGDAVSSVPRICSGGSFTLDLENATLGTGQTYQWQSSPDNTTWTNVGGSLTSPSFTTTHTAPTYYRAAVTCGGNTVYSNSVLVEYGGLSGTYTINSALPTGGTNFNSFADAVKHLGACISGPVVINVVPGSGPYTEQVTLNPVSGASATNTVTFNGNGETLQYNAASGTRHTIGLNGADYITFKKLNIVALNNTFGWGVHLGNGANNNTIDSCTIDLSAITSAVTTIDNSAGIVVANSFTDLNADGNANNNRFTNNTIKGGYQGIIINGAPTALDAVGNVISGNTIQDFHSIGIELTDNDGTIISGNDIHRINRVPVGTFEGIELGTGNRNVLVIDNRIHDTHTAADPSNQGTAAYGIFSSADDAPAGSENRIINNAIYNFNSNTGIQYGLYNSSSDGVRYYHNTVMLNYAGSTSGTTRGIYQTGAATNIEFKNNISYVARGGSGAKHAIYFGTTTSTITSNNNIFFVVSSAGTAGIGSWGTANQATLTAWQTTSSQDGLSGELDPQFASPSSFIPTNSAIVTVGTNVGVTTDINGTTRSAATPTPGAYEINLAACVSPPTAGAAIISISSACPGTTLNLDLTGHSTGSGQTYQWQSAPAQTGPWTDFGPSLTQPPTTVAPMVTTWYRVAVTCSGNTQHSDPVQAIIAPLFPAGTYTINSGQPTGGTNFASFADAIAAISCGIAGPVVFNVVPGSGPYNEQVVIPEVPGVSAVNTITFNGNNEVLEFNPVSATRYIIQMNGADYVIIKNLVIRSLNATYGWGIHFTNGADNNRVDSCTIDMTAVTSATIDNSAGIVVSNSLTDLNADGNANNNVFNADTIRGGYQGIIINGSATAQNAVNNQITNCVIQDFYSIGIEMTDNDGTLIANNDINRLNRIDVTTFEGIELGTGNRNVLITNNRIHDTHTNAETADQGTTAYGIYSTADDAPVGSENMVINNLLYNFNSASGLIYGIYNTGSDGVRYYHNTVVLDNAASTAGTTRGFYQTTAASNIEFKNNIIYLTRGGTGAKYGIYLGTTTSSVTSNNNVLYVNPTGTGAFGIGSWGTAAQATLAAWQAASSGDAQSISVDPMFAAPAAGNFYPNSGAVIGTGAGVGVTTDILGTARSAATPTPGAYEVAISTSTDLGAVDLFAPVQKSCYTANETVTVRIRNYSASTHNFVTNPVTVNVAVTGPNATTFTPVVVNTGTLPAGDTLAVVISTTYNMTASGTYTFTATTSVSGDGNAFNDAMLPASVSVTAMSAGTISASPTGFCITGGIPTITLTGSNGTIQWQEAADPAGPWANVGTGGTSYTPAAAITDTMYYRAIVSCTPDSDTTAVQAVTVDNPQLLTTTPGVRCGPGSVALNATGSNGATFNWYTDPTGGMPVASGATFNTPIINNTTTYYVAASSGGSGSLNAGLPAVISGTSGAGLANYGLVFDVYAPFTLNTVTIYPVSTTPGLAGTVTIDVIDGNNVVLHTATVNVIANPASSPVPQVVTLNFNLQPGTNYKMRPSARSTGISGLLFEPSASAPGGNYGYPFTIPGVVSIVTSTLTAAPANNPRPDLYYYFYNWTIATGCETARQPVVATVNAAPTFDVTNDLTVCNNAITTLEVTSTVSDFNDYQWSPATGLFTDPAATVPYTAGTSASTVYAKISTPGTYMYTVTANNTTTTCQNIDSVKVTVLPASITVTPSPDQLCVSGTSTITITPNPNTFGGAVYQWMSSSDNVTYTNIAGATGNSYTATNVTSTTFYKVEVKNTAGAVCLSAYDTIEVNSPQILTTTPAALCGPGTMTLGATANAGTTINWYDAPTGGALVGTGSSFTTPNLTQTATYYVAASRGGATSTTGITLSQLTFGLCGATTATTTTGWALRFTTTTAITINSVYVIPTAAGTVTITLHGNPSTGVLATATSQNFTTADVGTPQLVNLNFAISTPGNYQLVMASGGSHRITTLGCGYPMSNTSGSFVITGSATNTTGAVSTTTYNSFFNITVTESCESPRIPVQAQVSANTNITLQPTNVSICEGATAQLVVKADGAQLSYQWRKNGVNISGATNDTLTFSPATLADAANYDVVITGLCGNVTSQTATLVVAAGNSWVGAVSADWNNPANWCGGVPTSASDVTIPAGTPYQPVISSTTIANVNNLTIATNASLTILGTGSLNIYGNFVKSGTFSGNSGIVSFRGAANQNVAEIAAGTIIVNGAGVTLTGNMTANQSLILTQGNLTLGINTLTVNGSVLGSVANHIVTNSSGNVVTRNVGITPVTVPVGHSATSYNPVIIANGSGRDFSVRVSDGIVPPVANPGLAVNRTWNITASGVTPPTNVNITFQYEDGHMNASGVPTNKMEVGVYDNMGAIWNVISPAGGVTPSGSSSARTIGVTTGTFGPMVISNLGGISWISSAPGVDPTVTSMQLLPNLVQNSTILRVMTTRSTRLALQVVDGAGRVVMTLNKQVMVGQNDLPLEFSQLAAGVYYLAGQTDKGKTTVIRFVKM